jgi:hypothetical protein
MNNDKKALYQIWWEIMNQELEPNCNYTGTKKETDAYYEAFIEPKVIVDKNVRSQSKQDS